MSLVVLRCAAMTSGPKVRLGTKLPSMTSNWMRSQPAFSSALQSRPSAAKSAGSTDGMICTGPRRAVQRGPPDAAAPASKASFSFRNSGAALSAAVQ